MGGTPYKTFPGHFHLRKRGERWDISCQPEDTATSEEVMYDGAYTYAVTRNMVVDKKMGDVHPDFRRDIRESNGVAYAKMPTAIVFSGGYPSGASSIPRLLWLAYLSGSNLNASPGASFPAPWGATYQPESCSFKLDVEWPGFISDFPGTIAFVASGLLWSNACRALGTGNDETEVFPFREGFTSGMYQVVEWTNVNGSKLKIPSKFSLKEYWPGKDGSPVLLESYNCDVSTIKIESGEVALPRLDGDCNVLDYRFQDKKWPFFYVVYSITNSEWQPTNSPIFPALLDVYRSNYLAVQALSKKSATSSFAIGSASRKYIVQAVLLLTVLTLPAVMILALLRQRANKGMETTK